MIRRKVTLVEEWFFDELIVFDIPKKLSFSVTFLIIKKRLNRLLPNGNRKRGDVGLVAI